MILALDVGNTHIVLGCIEDMDISHIMRIETDRLRTEFEYAVIIKQVLEFEKIQADHFEGAIISSVVPQLTGTLKHAIKLISGIDAIVVGAGLKTGLNILIDNPGQLGSDLVVGAVAALDSYKPPLIVFDMGTATTISVIDAKANYLGGAIAPGIGVSLDSLSSKTSQLPMVAVEAPKNCIGTNTVDCMKSGAVYGTAAMVDGMIDRFEKELGSTASVIATGGLARMVVPYCSHRIVYDEDLLLRGLAVIYKKNRKK